MSLPLFNHLSDIESLLRVSQRILLFLDFDGTLAPIVDIPDQAVMPSEIRSILDRLRQNAACSVVIVSGRALSDIRERVGLAGLTYAGNHGLEICGDGLHFVEPAGVQRSEMLNEISDRVRERLMHISGVQIENKVLTASVHFRRARQNCWEEIRQTVYGELASLDGIFRVTEGLQVLEIRPHVDWNKGTAVRWIQERRGDAGTLSFYIGDDITDEDAFCALPAGVTVRVGQALETAARYHLEDETAVARFLAWLAPAMESNQSAF